MKRNKLKLISGVLLLSLLGSSCTKQLDRYPFSSIELSQSFKTMVDAQNWNNGMYSQLRGRVGGIYTYSTDVQADQLNASLDYGNRNGFPHRWEGFLAGDYTIRDVWSGYYSAINSVNVAIANLANIPTSSDAEATALKKYIGDAYFARAYYYHRLTLRWGKPYEPATAATDLSVPLILEYDPYLKPARATVKAVYDQILADIEQAKSYMGAAAGSAGAIKFNTDVVTALEARVKLDMQDWVGAKTAADALISSGTYPLITTEADLKKMWTNDFKQEVIYQTFLSAPNELGNTNGIYLGLIAQTGKFTPDFIPSQWVVDMYEDKDIRKATYFDPKTLTIQGSDYSDIYLVNKYPGNPDLFTGATTNYQNTHKLFRIAEMYLISAEAGARGGSSLEGDGLAKLNLLRQARGLDALTGLTGTALFDAVKDERFRELAFEGFRLNDLARWHEGFQRHDPQNINIITTGANFQGLTIEADADKFVWGIPTNDITVNPNILPQNKGW